MNHLSYLCALVDKRGKQGCEHWPYCFADVPLSQGSFGNAIAVSYSSSSMKAYFCI